MRTEKKDCFYFPFHIGSGNRGCEGIIEGIYTIIGKECGEYILLDENVDEKKLDETFGISFFASLNVMYNFENYGWLQRNFHKTIRKLGIRKHYYKLLPYKKFLKNVNDRSIVFFTGGDLYCYDKMAELNAELHEEIKKEEVKTVLFGCSVAEEFLTSKVLKQLSLYDLIVCRESLSVKNLKKNGITNNVIQCPDPAFVLEPEEVPLPKCFENKVVGINISDLVGANKSLDSIYGNNIRKLVQYILDKTTYSILLIPHVTWKNQDDRTICNAIYEEFFENSKIQILDISCMSYCQIRYVISKCEMFIGARTHSVISAYSTCVPTIALGYSIKSIGIANDIGLASELVLDCRNMKHTNEMINAYKYLEQNKDNIKNYLNSNMTNYKREAFKGKEYLYKYVLNYDFNKED
ncbi:MAG: polysaccharide pyruvyl transferase family protein [[Clostridium] symbiosum]|nr:polysaccharide pyruvyl transferase family protein [[Clostridium] symbiosum]